MNIMATRIGRSAVFRTKAAPPRTPWDCGPIASDQAPHPPLLFGFSFRRYQIPHPRAKRRKLLKPLRVHSAIRAGKRRDKNLIFDAGPTEAEKRHRLQEPAAHRAARQAD
jgi:hypothetical protein